MPDWIAVVVVVAAVVVWVAISVLLAFGLGRAIAQRERRSPRPPRRR